MFRTSLLISALFFGFSTTALAEHPGKVLHDDADCMKCHTNLGYNNEKTIKMEINKKADLIKAVSFCNTNLDIGWFDDEVEEVADYLNQEHYKLKN